MDSRYQLQDPRPYLPTLPEISPSSSDPPNSLAIGNETSEDEDESISRRLSLISQELSLEDNPASKRSRSNSTGSRGRRADELAPPEISLIPPSPCTVTPGRLEEHETLVEREKETCKWEVQCEISQPQVSSDPPAKSMNRSMSENTVINTVYSIKPDVVSPPSIHASKLKRSKQDRFALIRPGRFSLDHRIDKQASNMLEPGKGLGSARSPLLRSLRKRRGISMDMRSPSIWKQLRKTSADARYIQIVDIKDQFGEYVKNRRCSKETQDHVFSGEFF